MNLHAFGRLKPTNCLCSMTHRNAFFLVTRPVFLTDHFHHCFEQLDLLICILVLRFQFLQALL